KLTMKKTGNECFVAIDDGPPKRRMWIVAHDQVPPSAPAHHFSGWEIVIDEMSSVGDWEPLWDTIADTFAEALLYPPEYVSSQAQWRENKSGKPVDIFELEFEE
ncbi:MAG: hypothetical protein AAFV37_14225, partial [Pseudomonadota bacterium]